MQRLVSVINECILYVNENFTDAFLVLALAGTGIYFTFRTNFVQIRCFGEGFATLFGKSKESKRKGEKRGISAFQALCTSLSSQLGTGNIVGACSAVVLGGPGSVFWMWILAFFGMASAYAEGVVSVRIRTKNENGTFCGGPVYYIKRAFGGKSGKTVSGIFAFFAVISLGFAGNMVQANSVSKTFFDSFGVDTRITGIVLMLFSGAVMLLGADGIIKFAEKTVPVMSFAFVFGCVVMLFVHRQYIPACLSLVVKSAFSPKAVFGAATGYSVKSALFYGAKRGLFSNEAGMGTSPHAYAMVSDDITPHKQGTCAMLCVFLDTMVMMTLTAFSVMTATFFSEMADVSSLTSTNMTLFAFRASFGENTGNVLVSVCLLFFAFTSIVGWSMYGRINYEYLFGKKYVSVYYLAVLLFVYLGSVSSNSFVWNVTDFLSLFIVVPNVSALLCMSEIVTGKSK